MPRDHLMLAGGLALCLSVGLLLVPAGDVAAKRKTMPVELPVGSLPKAAQGEQVPAWIPWREIAVLPGDNLSLIFQRAGLSGTDVHEIMHRSKGGKALKRLHPGEKLSFHIDESGRLLTLKRQLTRLKTVIYTREGRRFSVKTVEREPQAHHRFHAATIKSSLYVAGRDAGISHGVITDLSHIFGGVIDFILDPRVGDTFHVLHEERYLDGEKLGDGNILAAEFVNKGRTYRAYRYVDSAGHYGYYDEHGVSMHKTFLMAPLDFTRISSRFNPRRLHPIYKTHLPHRGIDYAAPRGTPVYASGNGRVTEAGYTKANGNYVVIRHGETYTTKYLHLHKRRVKKGQRVQQNDIVGTVGSTGAATGPHLHYEFLINGVHRNPRTVLKSLPKAKTLTAAEKQRYLDHTRGLRMLFASRRQQLALNTAAE